ncbi:hypothetical protein BDDG_13225 [Blastomyces dermatitidis ATCC 18188]|uniref:Uncharacterized protein n=1 Tax=Ajellomyces dermatitidis (strain ATCC 18188 / CBS 674.68) TaxID=653446 RepID=A0A0J9HIN2_AJEDA|nr:hypothetical protein BDDG_13225 [Blastomyces dermatitidis ATCC 18188]
MTPVPNVANGRNLEACQGRPSHSTLRRSSLFLSVLFLQAVNRKPYPASDPCVVSNECIVGGSALINPER